MPRASARLHMAGSRHREPVTPPSVTYNRSHFRVTLSATLGRGVARMYYKHSGHFSVGGLLVGAAIGTAAARCFWAFPIRTVSS